MFLEFLLIKILNIKATSITWVFCGIFLVLAVLGFISEYLPIEKAFLETNAVYNITHLITAIGFAVASKKDVSITIQFIQIIGIAYMLISLIGFMSVTLIIEDQWVDVVYFNLLSYLQLGLGVTLSVFGTVLKTR